MNKRRRWKAKRRRDINKLLVRLLRHGEHLHWRNAHQRYDPDVLDRALTQAYRRVSRRSLPDYPDFMY